ncbi:MAG: Mth938-like domain-containing protein, partial [Rhodospirillaceae bacterium]
MQVTPDAPTNRMVVEGYGDGSFRISGQQHPGSVLVLPEHVEPWAPPGDFSDLTPEHFAAVMAEADQIDILLVGCGQHMALIPKAVREALLAVDVVPEPMTTAAACRTFNV